MDKRGGGRGGREYHKLLSKFCCLTVPKNFVVETFCAVFQKLSGSEKKVMDKKGGASRFSVESFLSNSAEKFVVEPFSVSLISGTEKIYASQGYLTIFRRKFFCLTVPKHFVDEAFCAVFQKNSGSKKVYG